MSGQPTERGGRWPLDRLKPVVEALVFASGDPLPARRITELVGATAAEVAAALEAIAAELDGRGIRLVEVAGGWQLRTAPEHHRVVKQLFKERPQRLTRASLETLAMIAYRQPMTKAEIESIRGVDCSGVLESLGERRLVRIAGRRDGPGRPLLYATTAEFLELFGLKDLRAMPTLPELGEELERMAEDSGFSTTGGAEAGVIPLEEGDSGEAQERPTPDQEPETDAAKETDPAAEAGPDPSEEGRTQR